jgi:membrane protein YqaA with SNARE-associated domain
MVGTLEGLLPLVLDHPLLFLSLLILLDTAFGVVPIEITVLLGIHFGVSVFILGVLGLFFSVLGALVDYLIGFCGIRLFSFPKRSWKKGADFFNRYGGWSLFIIRLIPFFPTKPISLIAGGMRYPLTAFAFYTGFGSFLRYYIEADLLERVATVTESEARDLIEKAFREGTDPSNYLFTLTVVLLVVFLYYLLVMKNSGTNES